MLRLLAASFTLPIIYASPLALPQAVTDAIAPSEPPPVGCMADFSGTFGIAVVNITSASAMKRRQADDQSTGVMYPVSQISDGQIQAATAPASTPAPAAMTVAQVNQIADGQVQGGMHTVTLQMQPTAAGQNAKVTYMPSEAASSLDLANSAVSPTTAPASNISASTSASASPANQTSSSSPSTNTTTLPTEDSEVALVACRTNSTLSLSLSDGILTDSAGRTGYIASNYQFQFDNPPQSAALFTAGWSVCSNGSLALGGSTTFWQCLSGEFYNLYDRFWAAQCSAVEVKIVELVDC